MWEEGGQYPDLIIELLSPATAQVDRTLKKALYQDRFHTPEYFWFSPDTLEFAGYRLIGQRYVEITPNETGYLWSEVLDLFLGVQNGVLRYFEHSGSLVPTPEEAANQAQAEAQQSQAEVLLARAKATRLAEQLRKLGVEPEA